MTDTEWVTVVDISRHQGAANFVRCRGRGVQGVIIRATHGTAVDERLAVNISLARSAGYAANQLGFYEFCNPKRGTPKECADALIEAVGRATGTLDLMLMLDIEAYYRETPNASLTSVPAVGSYLPPDQYARWLEEHINILQADAAPARIVGYTNRAYFDRLPDGVRSTQVAGMLEWIGARYPVYSSSGYAANPLPLSPAQWDEWAFGFASGPVLPAGAPPWQGWQFSAGYNGQGPGYGFTSADLDLNIIRPEAWARWMGTAPPTPPPSPELPTQPARGVDDMVIYTNSETRAGFAPDAWQYILAFDGEQWTKFHNTNEALLDPSLPRIRRTNAQLDGIPDFAGMKVPTSTVHVASMSGDIGSVPGRVRLTVDP
jgi:hypothetical protein